MVHEKLLIIRKLNLKRWPDRSQVDIILTNLNKFIKVLMRYHVTVTHTNDQLLRTNLKDPINAYNLKIEYFP
jgi:hypothetical protein